MGGTRGCRSTTTMHDARAALRPKPSTGRRVSKFAILATLTFARAFIPGAINFLQLPHVSATVDEVVPRSPDSERVALLLTILLVAYSAQLVLRSLPMILRAGSGYLAAIALLCYTAIGTYTSGLVGLTWLFGSLLPAFLVTTALWTVGVEKGDLRVCGGLGVFLAIYNLGFFFISPSHALFGAAGTSVKAIVGHSQLAGNFGQSNALGISLALVLPFCLLLSRRVLYRSLIFVVIAYSLVLSASRSAMIATACSILGAAYYRVGAQVRRRMIALSLVALGSIILILPIATTNVHSFTGRGAIWKGSLAIWWRHPILGLGQYIYTQVGAYDSNFGAYASSGHNMVVSLLTKGGLVELLLASSLLFLASRGVFRLATCDAGVTIYRYLVVFLVISMVEDVWVFAPDQDIFFFSYFLLLVTVKISCQGGYRQGSDELEPLPAGSTGEEMTGDFAAQSLTVVHRDLFP